MNSARPLPGSSSCPPETLPDWDLDRMRFMSFHVCRRGDLKGYSPPPGDSSSDPNYGCQRRDQHYQPLTGESRPPPVRSPSQPRRPTILVGARCRVPTSNRMQGRLPPCHPPPESSLRPTPTAAPDLAPSFDQWEPSVRNGLRAMHQRGDLRLPADPGRLATALLAAVGGGLL